MDSKLALKFVEKVSNWAMSVKVWIACWRCFLAIVSIHLLFVELASPTHL